MLCIGGIFDMLVFKVILGSLGTLGSKLSVTRKGIAVE